MTASSLGRFVLLALLWGSSFTFIKVSLGGLTPSQLVVSRLLLGAVFLLPIVFARKVALPTNRAVWAHIVPAALFGTTLPFLLLSYGERHTGAGMAGMIIGATPLLTLGMATLAVSTERASWRKLVGLLIGFAGVLLVISPWHSEAGTLTGQLTVLGAAAGYAIGFVYVRKFLSPYRLPALGLAASQLMVATVLQLAATPFLEWSRPQLTASVVGSVVALGVLGTGLAYVLYFRLIADTGATTASSVNYLIPVAAVAIGALTLGEPITWTLIVGGLVVLFGIAYAENRLAAIGRLVARGTKGPTKGTAPTSTDATAPSARTTRAGS